MQPQTIRTEAADGLSQLVSRGAAAVREAEQAPIGVLGFELAAEDLGGLAGVLVEAEFSERTAGLQRLDVRIGGSIRQPFREVAETALTRFGGIAYTNLVARTPEGRELFDLTVSFPRRRFDFYAENLLLLAEPAPEHGGGPEQAALTALEALHVSYKRRAGTLQAARRQLRKPIAVADQIGAALALFERTLVVELYAAQLPAVRSVRLISDGGEQLEAGLSRGLASATPISAADYVELQGFLREFFELEIGGKHWLVSNVHGTNERDRLGVIPARPKTTWSVNWGTKRQV